MNIYDLREGDPVCLPSIKQNGTVTSTKRFTSFTGANSGFVKIVVTWDNGRKEFYESGDKNTLQKGRYN